MSYSTSHKTFKLRFFVLTLNNLDGLVPENTVHVDFMSSTHAPRTIAPGVCDGGSF